MAAGTDAVRADAPAVVSPRRVLDRADLLARVDALAARLLAAGVAPGDRVVCSVEPGWEQVVALLGVLRAGGVHLPVPPGLGQVARWQRVTRSEAAVVLTQSWLGERLSWPDSATVIAVDEVEPGPTPATVDRAPEAAACLVPGEDGRDHVAVSHRAIVTTLTELNARFRVGPEDRVLALSSPESGFALYETVGALLAGATVVFGDDLDARDPAAWTALLRRERITVWHSPPTLLGMLVDHLEASGDRLPAELRLALVGGERFPADLVRRLRGVADPAPVVAALGAATVPGLWTTCAEIDEIPTEWRSVPIGRPLPNHRVFVLSETMTQCPVWVTGRLHFGGVAAEPCSDSDTESESGARVPHPETGEPLTPTGRFGRVLPDGVVEVVGDEAAQVTVHGRALNMQDTEVALAGHEAVRDAVVVPVTEGESVAHVRLAPGAQVDGPALLDFLRRKVSPYLLPTRVEVVTGFPLTSDGRVDRAALASAASPSTVDDQSAASTAPADDELIQQVTRIACGVLGVSDIEPNMNLLDVGATSIELVRLATLVEEELGITVDVEELLRFPSIAVLVSRQLGESETIPSAAPDTVSATGSGTESDTPPVPATPTAAAAPQEESTSASMPLLVGILERQAFKDAAHGIRHEYDDTEGVEITGSAPERLVNRRTHRGFDSRPVEFAAISELLSAMRQTRHGGEPKRWYPSAGSAYPVQAYLVVEPGRVRELPSGSYYHHPARNCLVPVVPGARVDASAHAEINRRSLRESAFSLYLVARMDAITPLYGNLAADFAMFEAGAMTQLLMEVATELGLGLCPVGAMETAPLRDVLRLGESDRFLHVLLGGYPGDRR
uniref:TlmIII n=1 Tax=Streptoalloteichus hindustanus TaxID=2017 RepID=A4KUB8_STRHI|nr:TlmIII [Streptoalloteichus hindustanus]